MKILKNEYPAPDKCRVGWKNLNGEWEFSFDEPLYDTKINVQYSWACPLSEIGERNKKGVGYYRKFTRYDKGSDRLFIVFGAVDYEAEIYVNDVFIKKHIGGYIDGELCEDNSFTIKNDGEIHNVNVEI